MGVKRHKHSSDRQLNPIIKIKYFKITVINSRITEMKNTLEENFPNMGNEIITHVQGSQRVPYKINPRRNMLRHINQTNKS